MKTTKAFNAFEMAQAQFDRVADILSLDQPTRDLLVIAWRHRLIKVLRVAH